MDAAQATSNEGDHAVDGRQPTRGATVMESSVAAPPCPAEVPKLPERSSPPLLTVIVPVFNEAQTIDELLRRVVAAPYDKEILVVDDGSTDGSGAAIADWESQSIIKSYRHSKNHGKGRAIRTALKGAKGRFIIIQDADLETEPGDYSLLIEPLLSGSADIVVGSRFLDCCTAASPSSAFRLGVTVLNMAVRMCYGLHLSDEACCFKALPTETLKAMNLQCERFDFCPEVIAKGCRMGLRFREVSIRYFPRTRADGKKIRYRDGLWALWCLWKLRTRWRFSLRN